MAKGGDFHKPQNSDPERLIGTLVMSPTDDKHGQCYEFKTRPFVCTDDSTTGNLLLDDGKVATARSIELSIPSVPQLNTNKQSAIEGPKEVKAGCSMVDAQVTPEIGIEAPVSGRDVCGYHLPKDLTVFECKILSWISMVFTGIEKFLKPSFIMAKQQEVQAKIGTEFHLAPSCCFFREGNINLSFKQKIVFFCTLKTVGDYIVASSRKWKEFSSKTAELEFVSLSQTAVCRGEGYCFTVMIISLTRRDDSQSEQVICKFGLEIENTMGDLLSPGSPKGQALLNFPSWRECNLILSAPFSSPHTDGKLSCTEEVEANEHQTSCEEPTSPPDTSRRVLRLQEKARKLLKKAKCTCKRNRKRANKLKKKAKQTFAKAEQLVKKGVRFLPKLFTKLAGSPEEYFDDAGVIEFNACVSPEVQNSQPPSHALQDESVRLRTFNKLGSNVPSQIQNLARAGFFCNDVMMLQCHSCLRISEISSVLSDPRSGHGPLCHYAKRLRTVIADTPGRISDDIRDPPGQQSIYIPPGDVRVESYRLSTFENFPIPSSSSRRSLAQAGFFFTGFFDRVKCFACGRTVQQWQENDNPADRSWHKENCPFLRGENCGNVPIGGHFNQFFGNLSTRSSPANPGEEVIQQRDPVTGAIIRTVRYPADLPERIRQTGGTFEIGPNNQVTIRSGPGAAGMRTPGLQQAPARLPPSPFQQSQHQPMRQWRMANVISADHKRFLTNLFLVRELDRVASFSRWPTERPNVAPAALAKTGFFYLGDMDRTQCFSCGGVLRNWTADDDAAAEHHAHFPNCRFLLGTDTRNVPVPDLPVPPEVRERDFPCRFPWNPHMRSEAARLETFDQRWPRERTAATPAEIAQAGFFYLGERDRVKCWYCNGGLQHWEYDDVPWIEHAKWFPNCQFLLSVKGQHFVYRHLAMSPQLPRPIIARQDGSPLDPGFEQSPSHPPEDIPPSAVRVRQPSPPPTIIDPQEEMRKKQQRIDDVMKTSDLVKNVLTMGFSEQIVRQLLVEKVESGAEESAEDIYGSTVALLDDVMKREDELKQEEEQRSSVAAAAPSIPGPSTSYITSVYSGMSSSFSSLGPAPGTGKYNVSYFGDEDEEGGPDMYGTEPMSVESSCNETPAKQVGKQDDKTSLQEALNKIEEERVCKVCFSNPADMVFVPCGHMCCCMECTQALRQCPVCRVKIAKAIKTYLS